MGEVSFKDPAQYRDASYSRHPMEDIEPIINGSDYREASKRFLFIITRSIQFIEGSDQKNVAVWQVAYALGLPMCAGRSMTQKARDLGLTRSSISKGAVKFCQDNGLPESIYMKKEATRGVYRSVRVKHVNDVKGKIYESRVGRNVS